MASNLKRKLCIQEIDAIEADFKKSLELEQFTQEEFDKLAKLCDMARQNADSYALPT